jgi:chromosomal replication initiator protein
LTISVPDQYFGKWLEGHYQNLILSSVEEVVGHPLRLAYQVVEPPKAAPSLPASPAAKERPEALLGLNQKYTFDDFVIGPGNRFAHAASVAVSESPAKQYNPLFIYGPTGLGKTHLLQAIAHEMKRRQPDFKILYISSEKFTNQLITAIQTKSTPQFRAKYRTLDLLLIDDVHFIAEKDSTQEEFFNTFNTLYDAHKQIVVTSDRPPRDIPGLEERLVSRFGWGLVTDIQPPDFETRVAILKKKMERETVVVPDDVSYFIAGKIKSNIRELEGALIRVVAYCTLTNSKIDVRLAQEILKDSFQEEAQKFTIEGIQKVVADYFNVKVSDLRAKKRTVSIVRPRQIAMYLVRELTTHSFPEIGEFFGGKDHTTVLHSCNKIARERDNDVSVRSLLDKLTGLLKK